jgi:prepilin-type N-terminal cleavage/methylation domain-containing protein
MVSGDLKPYRQTPFMETFLRTVDGRLAIAVYGNRETAKSGGGLRSAKAGRVRSRASELFRIVFLKRISWKGLQMVQFHFSAHAIARLQRPNLLTRCDRHSRPQNGNGDCKLSLPRTGFTLIELLVVIAIIGVLVASSLFGITRPEAALRISAAQLLVVTGGDINQVEKLLFDPEFIDLYKPTMTVLANSVDTDEDGAISSVEAGNAGWFDLFPGFEPTTAQITLQDILQFTYTPGHLGEAIFELQMPPGTRRALLATLNNPKEEVALRNFSKVLNAHRPRLDEETYKTTQVMVWILQTQAIIAVL